MVKKTLCVFIHGVQCKHTSKKIAAVLLLQFYEKQDLELCELTLTCLSEVGQTEIQCKYKLQCAMQFCCSQIVQSCLEILFFAVCRA